MTRKCEKNNRKLLWPKKNSRGPVCGFGAGSRWSGSQVRGVKANILPLMLIWLAGALRQTRGIFTGVRPWHPAAVLCPSLAHAHAHARARARFTSAGGDVLSASRLSDQMVLVEPRAVLCHHHR